MDINSVMNRKFQLTENNNQMSNQNIKEKDPFQEPAYTFFLFINTGSGAGLGGKLVSQQIKQISFQIPIQNEKDIKLIDVFFVDMRKNRQFGFKKLKKVTQQGKNSFAIVVGGDGTVMWVLSQFVNFQINPLDVPIGIIPTGTGNDFSRSLNWGGEKTTLLQHNFRSLKKLIRKWIHAKQSQFDVWDITAEIFPNGKFQKIQNGEDVRLKQQVIQKSFVNYFSFGIDGKVGYSFQKHRTSTRIGNLAMYAALGIIKQASTTKTIDELIQSFHVHCKQKNQQTCVFKSRFQSQPFEEQTRYITPGLKNILALNINSYTGGVSQIWSSAKQLFNQKQYKRTNPCYNDNKLQIVSFSSALAIAMERSIGGFGNRIVQDEGPFIFKFRSYPEQQKHRTYLQIDGQFIRFTHPKRVIIQKSKLFKNGKIKVLVNDPQYQPYIPQQ